jgi:hypothetical protein
MNTIIQENNYFQCETCQGLFKEEIYAKHVTLCSFNFAEFNSKIDFVKNISNGSLSLNKVVKNNSGLFTDEKSLTNLTEDWLKNGEIECSVCSEFFSIKKIEEHEMKCAEKYLERDRAKFVSILLNFTEYPDDWSKGMTENMRMDYIDPMDRLYQQIEKRFLSTVKNGLIQSIERIQNKKLWDKYTREKNRVISEKGSIKEHLLWHGCRGSPPGYISQTGFDISFANDGGMFGRGLYFARMASYSCPSYCYFDKEKNVYHVFLSKVITGICHVTTSGTGFKKPPFWDSSKMIYYDSVTNVDNKNDDDNVNQMYVVYENDKAYPYYLITYSIGTK